MSRQLVVESLSLMAAWLHTSKPINAGPRPRGSRQLVLCCTLCANNAAPRPRGSRQLVFLHFVRVLRTCCTCFLSNRFTARGARSCTVLPDYRGTGAIDYSSTTLPSPRYQTSRYRSLPHLHCTVVYQSTTASRYHRPRQRGLRYNRTTTPQYPAHGTDLTVP